MGSFIDRFSQTWNLYQIYVECKTKGLEVDSKLKILKRNQIIMRDIKG
jgi:hypothetical protein